MIKVNGKTKNSLRGYICKENYHEDDGFVGTFMKRVLQTNNFTMTKEESLISRENLIQKWFSPILSSNSRFKNMLHFKGMITYVTVC